MAANSPFVPFKPLVGSKAKAPGLRAQSALARRELVSQAARIMYARLSDPKLSLKLVANELAVSERHLQRAFVEQGSMGYRHELAKLRIREAARLIQADPYRSIQDVALQVGYRQPPQFAKAFRRHTGIGPKEWRSRCRGRALA